MSINQIEAEINNNATDLLKLAELLVKNEVIGEVKQVSEALPEQFSEEYMACSPSDWKQKEIEVLKAFFTNALQKLSTVAA
jgi:hypothetical protein